MGVLPQHRTAFNDLSPADRSKFYGELLIEIARGRISMSANDDLSDIMIDRFLPITTALKESDFIENLYEIYRSSQLVWNSIALRLSETPQLSRSSLTPSSDTPPAPTPPK